MHIETKRCESAKHSTRTIIRRCFTRNRIRTDGLYVSRNTYVKACPRREIGTSKKEHRPARVVVYYRYFRFLENGEWYSKTSPEPVRIVKKTMRDGKKANEDSSVSVGWYRLDEKEKEEDPLSIGEDETGKRIRDDYTFLGAT